MSGNGDARTGSGSRRTLTRATLALGLAVLGTLALGPAPRTARAQGNELADNAGPAPADDVLIERARTLLAPASDAEKVFESERDAVATGAEALEAVRARIAAPLPPEPPAAVTSAGSAAARVESERAAARAQALAARVRDREDESVALESQATQLGSALPAAGALATALDEALAPVRDLEARVKAGKLAQARLPHDASSASLATRFARARDAQTAWQAETTRVAEARRTAPERLASARAGLAAAEARAQKASRGLRDALEREALEKELEGKDRAKLTALLADATLERDRLTPALDSPRADLAQARAAAASLERALEGQALPTADGVRVGSKLARVAPAERALRLGEALTSWHETRTTLSAQLAAALAVVAEKADLAAKASAALDEELLRLDVIAGLVRATPGTSPVAASLAPEALAHEREAARRLTDEVTAARDAARARTVVVTKQAQDEGEAARRERDRHVELDTAYRAAVESARWTSEVETLPTPEVTQRLLDARAGGEQWTSATQLARTDVAATEAAVASSDAVLDALEDPAARRVRQEREGDRRKIVLALSRAAGVLPPPESPVIEPLAAPSPASVPTVEGDAGGPLRARTLERASFLSTRSQYFDQEVGELARLATALARHEKALGSLARAETSAREAAQRVYGAALELEMRVGVGQLLRADLPPGTHELANRDAIAALDGAIALTQARAARAAERRREAERLRDETAQLGGLLARSFANAGRLLETLRERAQLEAEFGAPLTSLTDTERKRLDQEIARRLEADSTLLERALSVVVTSERADSLTDLLRSLYRDLLDLERKRKNVEARLALTKTLIVERGDERPIDVALTPLERSRVARLEADDAEGRVRAGLVLPTDETARQKLAAVGRAVPSPESIGAETIATAADRLVLLRCRASGERAFVHTLETRLSPIGLDAELGEVHDELGGLAARLDALAREEQRLVGRGRDATVPPAAPATELALTSGEIGAARADRTAALERSALGSLARLALIPAIAILVVRFGRRAGVRLMKRARHADDLATTALERERRAQTLAHVIGTAWTLVVVSTAGMSWLRELGFNVTAILASAGVVGLAIAFGAQALVKDFLAGFFILVENQYKIGDTIKVGDCAGIVERVTLRMTVLRADDGTVFYVPNGTVDRVSNSSRGWARVLLELTVAYEENVDSVLALLREVSTGLEADEVAGPKLLEKPEVLGVQRIRDGAVTVALRLKTIAGEQDVVAREARLRIRRAFGAAGIKIPDPAPDRVAAIVPKPTDPEGPQPAGK